jgi:hypothetical protein
MKAYLGLVFVGIATGLAAAFLAKRVTAKLLIGVSSTDPATYVVVAGILGSIALLACYIPPRRAAQANPPIHWDRSSNRFKNIRKLPGFLSNTPAKRRSVCARSENRRVEAGRCESNAL